MNQFIADRIWRLARMTGLGPFVLRIHPKSALKESGWYRSFRASRPVDAAGKAIPWWTYSCLHFLVARLPRTARVLEFGCGHSSIWLGPRVKELLSIETHADWAQSISSRIESNTKVVTVPSILKFLEDPESAIGSPPGKFEMVIIDADHRAECARWMVQVLSESGVVLWDDTERGAGQELMAGLGFRELPFRGMRPQVIHTGQTSIFYRDGNCLGI